MGQVMRLILPEWLDKAAWTEFVNMRKQMAKDTKGRVPFTDYAEELVLMALEDFYRKGHDPNASLRNSIMNGYRGVFPVGERVLRDKSGSEYYIGPEGCRVYKH